MRAFLALAAAILLSLSVNAESAAGLKWTSPATWRHEPAQAMRAATYSVAPAPGDTARGECAVYFFGKGQGGSVNDNVARWKSQFKTANGAQAPAQVATRSSHGLTITTVDTSGSYSGMGGPMGGAPVVAGYRLLGAIVEGPGGSIFIKFTGPLRTVGANQLQFEQLLASFQPEK